MIFSRKTKCVGCASLLKGKSEKGEPIYSCRLVYRIQFDIVDGDAVKPVPAESCYKPTSKEELEKASKLSDKRRGA